MLTNLASYGAPATVGDSINLGIEPRPWLPLSKVAYETGYYSTVSQPRDGGAGLIHMIPNNWPYNGIWAPYFNGPTLL